MDRVNQLAEATARGHQPRTGKGLPLPQSVRLPPVRPISKWDRFAPPSFEPDLAIEDQGTCRRLARGWGCSGEGLD